MSISVTNSQKLFKVDLKRVRKSLRMLMKQLHCDDKEISLLIVDDANMTRLNKHYFDRNCPTNVISFTMAEGEFGDINPQILGDIVISVQTAYRDAAAAGIDPMDEVEFLIIHGLLHLIGYDHERTGAQCAKEMNDLQGDLFFQLRHHDIDRE
jgi:probable rRNA maturation factor